MWKLIFFLSFLENLQGTRKATGSRYEASTDFVVDSVGIVNLFLYLHLTKRPPPIKSSARLIFTGAPDATSRVDANNNPSK
jgi:hypothetical protein